MNKRIDWLSLVAIATAIAAAMMLVALLIRPAKAHDWYPFECGWERVAYGHGIA
jgi:hypothetical protein